MSRESHAGNAEIFTARSSRVFAGICWGTAAVGIAATLASAGPAGLPGAAPLLFIAYMGWVLFWRPAVVVRDTGVTLENPYRTITVPWEALATVDTRYALTLVTPRGKYAAWAAPAPGIWGGRNARPEHLRGLPGGSYGPGQSVRPGDLRNTDSGAAALMVRSRWEQLVEAGRIEAGRADTTPVTVAFAWQRISVTLVLAAAGAWAVFVL
jgi:hypothetical protein